MTLLNFLLGLAIFFGFCVIFWLYQRKQTKKAHIHVEVTEPQEQKKSRLALAASVASAKMAVGKIKPHFKGTFGVCVAVILFGAALLVWAEPTAAKYLWIVPVLIATTFLMVKVANTIKNEFMRGVIYVAIGLPVLLFVGPKLPGSTPALPIPYTQGQLAELARLRQACPGQKVDFTYTPVYQVVNRSQCFVYYWIGQNEIYVQDAQGNEHGPYCNRSGCADPKITYEIRAFRSARGTFVGQIKKDPDYSTLSFYYADTQ